MSLIGKKIRWVLLFAFGTVIVSASAGEYELPAIGEDVVGYSYIVTVGRKDSLTSIRQTHEVSYDELLEANPTINFYKLRVGQQVVIPKQFVLPSIRTGIVINIPELRLYYFDPDNERLHTFTVGLGREHWRTPLGVAKVVGKRADPAWRVPSKIREYVYRKTGKVLPEIVSPGPENPLGRYALYLNMEGYLIHGTNAPTSVGAFISSGCVRMLREPLEFLYRNVDVGTTVHIIHQPYKVGWFKGKLYLESHRPIPDYYHGEDELRLALNKAIFEATRIHSAKIDWDLVLKNSARCSGLPEAIGI